MVNKADTINEKWLADKAGGYCRATGIPSTTTACLKRTDAKVGVLTLPEGPNGDSGALQADPLRFHQSFGSHLDHEPEKLEKYLELYDYAAGDMNFEELTFKGIEGVTYP